MDGYIKHLTTSYSSATFQKSEEFNRKMIRAIWNGHKISSMGSDFKIPFIHSYWRDYVSHNDHVSSLSNKWSSETLQKGDK